MEKPQEKPHMDALAQRRISPDRYTPGYYLHCMPMRRVAA